MNMVIVLAQALPTRAAESYGLTAGGWLVMLLSVGFVTTLLGWCIWRVSRESRPDKLHGQIDVDTHDVEA